jgi:hypothetical protein
MGYKLALLVAVANDLIDYYGGAIPIAGDILDIAASGVLLASVGILEGLVSLLELIPGVDFIPTYVIIVILSIIFGSDDE